MWAVELRERQQPATESSTRFVAPFVAVPSVASTPLGDWFSAGYRAAAIGASPGNAANRSRTSSEVLRFARFPCRLANSGSASLDPEEGQSVLGVADAATHRTTGSNDSGDPAVASGPKNLGSLNLGQRSDAVLDLARAAQVFDA